MTNADSSNEDRSTSPGSDTHETTSNSAVSGTPHGARRYRHDALDVTYEEARRVVKHQLDSVNDIDSKAAHTLRVLFVLFGLLITASSLLINTLLRQSATSLAAARRFINAFTTAGTVLLLISLLIAIWTYNETHTRPGLSPSAISALSRDTPREQRFRQLFSQFPKWMIHNETAIRRDSTLLFASHATMFLGLVSLIVGVVSKLPLNPGTSITGTPFPLGYLLVGLGILVFGLGASGRVPTHSRWTFTGYARRLNRVTLLGLCGLILVLFGLVLLG